MCERRRQPEGTKKKKEKKKIKKKKENSKGTETVMGIVDCQKDREKFH